MNKNKAKRIERVLGWTKASHKGAVRYFTKEKVYPIRSLKKKKKCKFNKGVHEFKKTDESDFFKRIYSRFMCVHCGKQKWTMKNGDIGVVGNIVPCEGIVESSNLS